MGDCFGGSVIAGERLFISREQASGEVKWWGCCYRGLVGGGGNVVGCFICGYASGYCEYPWRFCLGARLQGGLLVGVRCFGVVDVEGFGCEPLFLFGAYCVALMWVCRLLYVW